MRHPIQWHIRPFNKHILNRVMLKFAGAPASPIAVIRHVGRRSGTQYSTPIVAQPTECGFMFALTYGPDVDWYRNVLAAGKATLRWHGKDYPLEDPKTADVQAALLAFPWPLGLVLRGLGICDFFSMAVVQPISERNSPAAVENVHVHA
jgi:deazaflavin-dependent oxidoreductase (nitroreductase family)